MNRSPRYPDIVAFGIQGAGKGEQGKILQRDFGYVPFSTGDAFRALDKESDLGKTVQEYMQSGQLVPDDITLQVVQSYLDSVPNLDQTSLYIDGFPRNVEQIPLLEEIAASRDRIYKGLTFDLPEIIARERMQGRGRADDLDPAAVDKRIAEFKNKTVPVIDAFERAGNLIRIDAHQPIEDIAIEVRRSLDLPPLTLGDAVMNFEKVRAGAQVKSAKKLIVHRLLRFFVDLPARLHPRETTVKMD